MILGEDKWNPIELAESRSSVSLAAQVIYQTRVFAILRDNLDCAAELLRNPVALQKAYKARYAEEFRVGEIDDWP